MIVLVDTSVWVDHLRLGDADLVALLKGGNVLLHPFVQGELALGNLRQREAIQVALGGLPAAIVAMDTEVLRFIESQRLFGRGIGYVDAHLLASVQLTPGTFLWTRDKRLRATAQMFKLAAGFG